MHVKMMHTINICKKTQPLSYLGTCKMRNETRNETKFTKTKRNETTPCLSLTYTEGFPKWANPGANCLSQLKNQI